MGERTHRPLRCRTVVVAQRSPVRIPALSRNGGPSALRRRAARSPAASTQPQIPRGKGRFAPGTAGRDPACPPSPLEAIHAIVRSTNVQPDHDRRRRRPRPRRRRLRQRSDSSSDSLATTGPSTDGPHERGDRHERGNRHERCGRHRPASGSTPTGSGDAIRHRCLAAHRLAQPDAHRDAVRDRCRRPGDRRRRPVRTIPAEALELPHDLSGFEPNVEAIAAYEPDLVVTGGDTTGLGDQLGRSASSPGTARPRSHSTTRTPRSSSSVRSPATSPRRPSW